MRIGVDAMGGDYAPRAVIEGVLEAIRDFNVQVTLVGQEDRIKAELKGRKHPAGSIDIVHAPEVITMDDPATSPLRKKKDSSIAVGINLLKEGRYAAFISAGNTGAMVAASTFTLGMLEGVERPAIGLVIPTLTGFAFLIDVGATTDPKASHMLQTTQMAKVYARLVLDKEKPTVGLLNIGSEAGKGSGFEKETHKLLEENITDFVGNLEANSIFKGKGDCIICDGYTGNVVIKVSQGLMESAGKLMKREIVKSPIAMLGAALMKSRLKHVMKLADYTEYGGAPLLGVNGLVMISHGRSSPKAIKNAIRATMREVEHDVLENMKRSVARR